MSAPIAIYVHLPWCVRKCPYCDFNSHVRPDNMPGDGICRGAARRPRRATSTSRRAATSPASSSAAARRRCSASTRSRRSSTGSRRACRSQPDAEITMEANPGTVEHGRFAGYAKAGINRVSLGAQSFDAAALATLGRIHGPGEIGVAVAELVAAGLDNFNLDLMYGAAGADARRRARGCRGRDCARPRAPFALPADARAGHGVLPPAAPAAGRRPRVRRCSRTARRASRRRASRSTKSPPTRGPDGSAGTTSTTGASATTSASAPARTARSTVDGPSCAPRSRARRAPTCRAAAASRRNPPRHPAGELPFEFMLNALRLAEGFTLAEFERATGLPAASCSPGCSTLQVTRGLIEAEGTDSGRPDLGFAS